MARAPFIFGLAGYSGSGKTTLAERLIAKAAGQGVRIATIKHAHHRFEADIEGKDSWRHRKAGAQQTLIASAHRSALFTEMLLKKDLHYLICLPDWMKAIGFWSKALNLSPLPKSKSIMASLTTHLYIKQMIISLPLFQMPRQRAVICLVLSVMMLRQSLAIFTICQKRQADDGTGNAL